MQAVTPSWVWPVLVFGTVVMLAWAWFIVGFLAEPSAVGRLRFILVTSSVYSIGSALVAIVGEAGPPDGGHRRKRNASARSRRDRWDPGADRPRVEPQLLQKLS